MLMGKVGIQRLNVLPGLRLGDAFHVNPLLLLIGVPFVKFRQSFTPVHALQAGNQLKMAYI